MNENQQPTRRHFLDNAAKISVGLAVVGTLSTPRSVHAGGSEALRVGLVGCGGRGTGAALDALSADSHAELVAVADTFSDKADDCLRQLRGTKEVVDRVKVSPDHVFTGFDGYKQVIDLSDVVLLATPPHFRPEHFAYVVDQGKHCFIEKPIAVDMPGIKSVMESSRKAKEKNLAVVSGLCWRYDHKVREVMRQLLDERAIGDIIAIESSYNAGNLWHRGADPKWSRMEYQVRNWLYYTWLSGDHIMEQAIHSMDKTAWLLGDQSPTKAMSLAGRQQRIDEMYGNVFDHFAVFYEYPTGQRVYFTCRQQDGCSMRTDETVLGSEGRSELLRGDIFGGDGKRKWRFKGPQPSMYRVEHQEMFESIRKGSPINNGHYMCNSTTIALMGRMAGYTGQTVTWDQVMSSTERLGPKEYAWGEVDDEAVAIPGKTKIA